MILKYTNTEDEIYDFLVYRNTHSEKFIRQINSKRIIYGLVALFAGGWGAIMMVSYFKTNGIDPETAHGFLTRGLVMLAIGLITLLMIVFLPQLRRNKIAKNLKKAMSQIDKEAFSQIILKLDEKEFIWDTLDEDGSVALTQEIGVVENENTYFVNTKKTGFVIPKRAFNEKNTEETFRKLLNVEDRINRTQKKEQKIREKIKKEK